MEKQKKIWVLCAWALIALLSKSVNFGFLLGSKKCAFSGFSAALPCIAFFLPISLSGLAVGSVWFATHASRLFSLTMGIPTFFAALSWHASKQKGSPAIILHVILPAACMATFSLSAVGKHAWPYSLFWLIPLVLHFMSFESFGWRGVAARSLQSTFTAHAVGSVMWLFLTPMPAEQWISLIPVVALERLFLASWACGVVGMLHYVLGNESAMPASQSLKQAG